MEMNDVQRKPRCLEQPKWKRNQNNKMFKSSNPDTFMMQIVTANKVNRSVKLFIERLSRQKNLLGPCRNQGGYTYYLTSSHLKLASAPNG